MAAYIKQLDSVRAIAVILVLFQHWIPDNYLIRIFPNGAFGVTIFFVLSGFLITGILLRYRISAEKVNEKLEACKNFFMRRCIRIFPIYYLALLLLLLSHYALQTPLSKHELLSNLTYTTNFYIYKIKIWPYLTNHFWSLAVEEQFYLFWPLLMIFVNKKFLLPVILLFISIGILTQLLITDREFGYTPTYTCFDALGFGAFLQWIIMFNPNILGKFLKTVTILAAGITLFLIINSVFKLKIVYPQRTALSVISLWIIAKILCKPQEKGNQFSNILDNKILLFLGKISYGIYVFHIPCQLILYPYITHFFSKSLNDNIYFYFTINLGLVTLFSYISWKTIEKPLLTLKKYFEYGNYK